MKWMKLMSLTAAICKLPSQGVMMTGPVGTVEVSVDAELDANAKIGREESDAADCGADGDGSIDSVTFVTAVLYQRI